LPKNSSKFNNCFFFELYFYSCLLSVQRFKESTHLRKHLYTHTGERPHFCSYCAKGFQTSSDLKRHKKTRVHQERVDQCNTGTTTSGTAAPTTAAQSHQEKSKFFNQDPDSFHTDPDTGCSLKLNLHARFDDQNFKK
jgi:uncharacterized Zn-finger protein